MKLVQDSITLAELEKMSEKMFGKIVKAVVDIEQGIMVVDADMHVDQEAFLLENGFEQAHLWGINLHPDKVGSSDFIEFDSMVNIRPGQGNMGRGVYDPARQAKIRSIVTKLVQL